MRLQNKTAIVTGASRGIGLAISEMFIKEGANVAMVSRPSEHLHREVERLNAASYHSKALELAYDVSVEQNWDTIIHKTIDKFGKIDICVNNASMTVREPGAYVDNFSQQVFDKVFSVNLYAALYSMKRLLNLWSDSELKGNIVNILSTNAIHPIGNASHGSSKAALLSASKQQALFWAKKGLRINCISPGTTKTDLTKHIWDNPENARYIAKTSKSTLSPFGEPEDIAYAALFLASDEAKHITGINLIVDGGAILN
jgi:NAD(P)-dependent dehydrogenase (short-subunit alcohol dehydrogenase family)